MCFVSQTTYKIKFRVVSRILALREVALQCLKLEVEALWRHRRGCGHLVPDPKEQKSDCEDKQASSLHMVLDPYGDSDFEHTLT